VSDWFAFALLLILSALTVCIFAYVVILLRQLPRARAPHAKTKPSQPPIRGTQFHQSGLLAGNSLADSEDPRILWQSLTGREKQVARLAAAKLTDAEIAARLSISGRTVGNHLYNVYRKLDISSRRELERFFRRLDGA
jgi:DNA-binding CsgD family transcriptional regulator